MIDVSMATYRKGSDMQFDQARVRNIEQIRCAMYSMQRKHESFLESLRAYNPPEEMTSDGLPGFSFGDDGKVEMEAFLHVITMRHRMVKISGDEIAMEYAFVGCIGEEDVPIFIMYMSVDGELNRKPSSDQFMPNALTSNVGYYLRLHIFEGIWNSILMTHSAFEI